MVQIHYKVTVHWTIKEGSVSHLPKKLSQDNLHLLPNREF